MSKKLEQFVNCVKILVGKYRIEFATNTDFIIFRGWERFKLRAVERAVSTVLTIETGIPFVWDLRENSPYRDYTWFLETKGRTEKDFIVGWNAAWERFGIDSEEDARIWIAAARKAKRMRLKESETGKIENLIKAVRALTDQYKVVYVRIPAEALKTAVHIDGITALLADETDVRFQWGEGVKWRAETEEEPLTWESTIAFAAALCTAWHKFGIHKRTGSAVWNQRCDTAIQNQECADYLDGYSEYAEDWEPSVADGPSVADVEKAILGAAHQTAHLKQEDR